MWFNQYWNNYLYYYIILYNIIFYYINYINIIFYDRRYEMTEDKMFEKKDFSIISIFLHGCQPFIVHYSKHKK